jgi:hypothetical protein
MACWATGLRKFAPVVKEHLKRILERIADRLEFEERQKEKMSHEKS